MSTFFKNSGKTIQTAFNAFDKKNPHVYAEYKRLVWQAIKAGKKKISSKLILNVIRWHIYLETEDEVGFTDSDGVLTKFRINDAYTSRYVRKYVKEFPSREKFC